MIHTLKTVSVLALSMTALAACTPVQSAEKFDMTTDAQVLSATSGPQAPFRSTRTDGMEEMIVAGGCFWCIESDLEKVEGVSEVISGYSGGGIDGPTYKVVGKNNTGHYEVVKVVFDPNVVSYRELVDIFWRKIDPTDDRGQFCDKGESYRSAVFATPEQMADAQASLAQVKADKPFKAKIVTPVLPAVTFYAAEDYHQDYYKKNPAHYNRYRRGCGRDARVKMLWGT